MSMALLLAACGPGTEHATDKSPARNEPARVAVASPPVSFNAVDALRTGRPRLTVSQRRWLIATTGSANYRGVRSLLRFVFPSTIAVSTHALVVYVPEWRKYGGHVLGEPCNVVFNEGDGMTHVATGAACVPPTPPPI